MQCVCVDIVFSGIGFKCMGGCWNLWGMVVVYVLLLIVLVVFEIFVYVEDQSLFDFYVLILVCFFESFVIFVE